MARSRSRTRRTGKRRTLLVTSTRPGDVIDIPPVRGVKLKHVSTFTMLVAVACLLAYLAGRVDVSAATSVSAVTRGSVPFSQASQSAGDLKEHNMFLGLRTVKYDVQDIAKAKDWYSKVFGVAPYFDEPAYYVGYNIGGYEPLMTAANTIVNTPYVMTMTGMYSAVTTSELTLTQGTFSPDQMIRDINGEI